MQYSSYEGACGTSLPCRRPFLVSSRPTTVLTCRRPAALTNRLRRGYRRRMHLHPARRPMSTFASDQFWLTLPLTAAAIAFVSLTTFVISRSSTGIT